MLELALLLQDDAARGVAAVGLTLPRVQLTWLVHHHGPMTQRALADALRVTPRNVTGLVDALVADGFVSRGAHPTDRRATLVSLTDHGAAVMTVMARDYEALAERLFGEMPDPAAFSAGLDHVLSRLKEALSDS
ncbi:MarR family transcriptional regulator [Solirubrobacter taibaiensis]|nr:MarR family transcriptional regulator [Solirubrobacter taibaiensis]